MIILLLLLLYVTSSYAFHHHSKTNQQVSQEIIKGLQSTTSTSRPLKEEGLNIVTNFYDKSTGLYSEGIWHNCMAGIASLQLSKVYDTKQNNKNYNDAMRIANSLFNNSWDDTSFRRRVWSGKWDHSQLLDDTRSDKIEQANYYRESNEHRCIQHGIALVFWSLLAQQQLAVEKESGGSKSCSSITADSNDSTVDIRSQQSVILEQFINEFWNGQHWTTISKAQGSGTIHRPSTSSNKQSMTTDNNEEGAPYYRAVDQAVAVLGLLQHIQFLDCTTQQNTVERNNSNDERERIVQIIEATCKELLDLDGFGYNNLSNSRTYLGIDRNRNFWHEGLVFLALASAAQDCNNIWPMDTREGYLHTLWNDLMKRYNAEDGIWHWPISEKDIKSKNNVRYCGDNALCYAIRRKLLGQRRRESEKEDEAESKDEIAFWTFVNILRKDNMYQLASVADVYPQVRLHPNTELAAFLVWPTEGS